MTKRKSKELKKLNSYRESGELVNAVMEECQALILKRIEEYPPGARTFLFARIANAIFIQFHGICMQTTAERMRKLETEAT